MNTRFISLVVALFALLFAGCANGIIRSASTKLEVKTPEGKSVAFTFPKELDAKGFDLSVNPVTGAIKLKSESITTSSSAVIDSAGKAQAQAMADMAKAFNSLASVAVPLLVPAAAPLVKKPAPQDTPAEESE